MTGFMLHLMRHGEPKLSGCFLGRTDSPSTEAGMAACLAQSSSLHFERLVSSPLLRARSAAEKIAAERELIAELDDRWRELDFGDWEGIPSADIEPVALSAFWTDPDINPPPSGERWSDLAWRINAAISSLQPIDTLIVAHGGPIRAALSHLFGFSQKQLWAFDLPYAAVLSLRLSADPLDRWAQITGLSQP